MQRTYAMAELRLPRELKTGLRGNGLRAGRLCTPAHFPSDPSSDWSLYVWLEQPAEVGASIIVPVTPVVSEAAERLLQPEALFELFLGKDTFAPGRVLSVNRVSDEDLRCVFHLC